MGKTLKKNARRKNNRINHNKQGYKPLNKKTPKKYKKTKKRYRTTNKIYKTTNKRYKKTLHARRHRKRTNMRKTRRMNKRTINKKIYYQDGGFNIARARAIRQRMPGISNIKGFLTIPGLCLLGVSLAVAILLGIGGSAAVTSVMVPVITQVSSLALECFAIWRSSKVSKKSLYSIKGAPNMLESYEEFIKNILKINGTSIESNRLRDSSDRDISTGAETLVSLVQGAEASIDEARHKVDPEMRKKLEKDALMINNYKVKLMESVNGRSSEVNSDEGDTVLATASLEETFHSISAIGKASELSKQWGDEDGGIRGSKAFKDLEEAIKQSKNPDPESGESGSGSTVGEEVSEASGQSPDVSEVDWEPLKKALLDSMVAGSDSVNSDQYKADLNTALDEYIKTGDDSHVQLAFVRGATDSDVIAKIESDASGEISLGLTEGSIVVINGLLFRAVKISHQRWLNVTGKDTEWDYWDRPDDRSILFLRKKKVAESTISRMAQRMLPGKKGLVWADQHIYRNNWNGYTDGGCFIMRRSIVKAMEEKFHNKLYEDEDEGELFYDKEFTTLEFDFHHVYDTVRAYIKPLDKDQQQEFDQYGKIMTPGSTPPATPESSRQSTPRGGDMGGGMRGGSTHSRQYSQGYTGPEDDIRREYETDTDTDEETATSSAGGGDNNRYLEDLAKEIVDRLKPYHDCQSYLNGVMAGEGVTTRSQICETLMNEILDSRSDTVTAIGLINLINDTINILAFARYVELRDEDDILPTRSLLKTMRLIKAEMSSIMGSDLYQHEEIFATVGIGLIFEDQITNPKTVFRDDHKAYLDRKVHVIHRNILNGFCELRRKNYERTLNDPLGHRVLCMSDFNILYGGREGSLNLFSTYSDEGQENYGDFDDVLNPAQYLAASQDQRNEYKVNNPRQGEPPISVQLLHLDRAGMYDLFATTLNRSLDQTLFDNKSENVLIKSLLKEISRINRVINGEATKEQKTQIENIKLLKRHLTANLFCDTCTGNDLFTKIAGVSPPNKGMELRELLSSLWDDLPRVEDPYEEMGDSMLENSWRLSKSLAENLTGKIPDIVAEDAVEDRPSRRKEEGSIYMTQDERKVKDPYEQRKVLEEGDIERTLEMIPSLHTHYVKESDFSNKMEDKRKEKLVEAIREEASAVREAEGGQGGGGEDYIITENEVYKEIASQLFSSYSWAHSLMCSPADVGYRETVEEGGEGEIISDYFIETKSKRNCLYTNDHDLLKMFNDLNHTYLIPVRVTNKSEGPTTSPGSGERARAAAKYITATAPGAAVASLGIFTPLMGAVPAIAGGTTLALAANYLARTHPRLQVNQGARKERQENFILSEKNVKDYNDMNKAKLHFARKIKLEIELQRMIKSGWENLQEAEKDKYREKLTFSILSSIFGEGKPTVSMCLLSHLSHSIRVYPGFTRETEQSDLFEGYHLSSPSAKGKFISLAVDYVLLLIMLTLTDTGIPPGQELDAGIRWSSLTHMFSTDSFFRMVLNSKEDDQGWGMDYDNEWTAGVDDQLRERLNTTGQSSALALKTARPVSPSELTLVPASPSGEMSLPGADAVVSAETPGTPVTNLSKIGRTRTGNQIYIENRDSNGVFTQKNFDPGCTFTINEGGEEIAYEFKGWVSSSLPEIMATPHSNYSLIEYFKMDDLKGRAIFYPHGKGPPGLTPSPRKAGGQFDQLSGY